MKCPSCHRSAQIEFVQHTELGPDNRLVPMNVAVLTCGCKVPMSSLAAHAPLRWEANARKRTDDNLRSIFS